LHFDLVLEGVHVGDERLDLLLELSDMRRHLLEFACEGQSGIAKLLGGFILGFLKIIAAVGRIVALERQIPASLTRRLPIAFDLPALALIAAAFGQRCLSSCTSRVDKCITHQAIDI
jgi:hypothetical protein